MKQLIKKLKKPANIMALASGVILILTTNGVAVDSERVMVTVKALCSIGVLLGILNNSETAGMDSPFKKH